MEASSVPSISPRGLTKAEILSAADALPRRLVDVPELGGSVWLQAMSATTRDAYESSLLACIPGGGDATQIPNARSRFLAFSMVDDDGALLFVGEDEIAMLGQRISGKTADRLLPIARELTPLTEDDYEELAGN